MRRLVPWHLLLEALLAANVLHHALASSTWYNALEEIHVSLSTRIRAEDGLSSISWGGGTALDPVGLRSVEYMFATKKPYEWFLKFDLSSFQGRWAEKAELYLSKCKASSACGTNCKDNSKCSCATIMNIASASCGGGNLDETYDASSDDIHAWYVPNDWDASWKFSDWRQTWSGKTRAGVESCCDQGDGGPAKLSFGHYLSGQSVVGESGTAVLNVLDAIGEKDASAGNDAGASGTGVWTVKGGMVSLRITVNGTASRFYVPEGGDSDYVPKLKFIMSFTTTTTPRPLLPGETRTTTNTSTTTGTTISTTTGTGTTITTATAAGGTTTSGTTTTYTGTTVSQTTVTATTGTGTTTTYTGTTTTVNGTTVPVPTTTVTGPTTLTTTGPTTNYGSIVTTTSTTAVVQPGGAQMFTIQQVFELHLSEAADMANVTNRSSFQANCQSAAAYALGKAVSDVQVISVGLDGGRRLAVASLSLGAKVLFRYSIAHITWAEMNATIAQSFRAEFARAFSKQLILAEQALPGGLRITWLHTLSLNTLSAVPHLASQPSPNRTAQGGVLDIYGSPEWGSAVLQSWAEGAVPAIRAALVVELSPVTPSVAPEDLMIHVAAGPVVITPEYGHARFEMFAAVPPLPQIAHDLDGKLYLGRVQSYHRIIASLSNSTNFSILLRAELKASGVPDLPSMSFHPGAYSSDAGYAGAAASGEVVAIICGAIVVLTGFFYLWVQRRKLRSRALGCICCCCPDRMRDREAHVKQEDGPPGPEEIIIIDHVQSMVDLDGGMQDRVTPMHHQVHDDTTFCICGNALVPDAKFCRSCGRQVKELARERYVMAKTQTEMENREGQLDSHQVMQGARSEEVELPPSPSGLSSNFFQMLDASQKEEEQTASQRLAETTPSKKKNKFLGANRDRKPLRHEANSLRLAMGGTLNKSVKAIGGATESMKVIGKVSTFNAASPGSTRASTGCLDDQTQSFRSRDDTDLSQISSPDRTRGSLLSSVGESTPLGRASLLSVGSGRPASGRSQRSGRPISPETNSSVDDDVDVIEVSSSSSSSEEEEEPSPQRGGRGQDERV